MKKKKILLLLFILGFFGVIFIKQQFMISRIDNEYNKNLNQLSKLKEQNTMLTDQLNRSKDEKFIEDIAREKFGLIKPGEILFVDKEKKRD
jgi:cell division protein DivIC